MHTAYLDSTSLTMTGAACTGARTLNAGNAKLADSRHLPDSTTHSKQSQRPELRSVNRHSLAETGMTPSAI